MRGCADMILAHLPAGYRLAHWRLRARIPSRQTFMFWGLAGSIAPDLDMLLESLILPTALWVRRHETRA